MTDSKQNKSIRVFILTGEWTDYKGKNVLKFIGSSEELGPVEIIISNNKPVFFIQRDSVVNPLNKSFLRKKVELKNFSHQNVDALYFNTQKDLLNTVEELNTSNIASYESDVDPLRRYLMEKYIYSQVSVDGDFTDQNGLKRFLNPVLKPCDYNPEFLIASLDIETGATTNRLYSIAVHLSGKNSDLKKVFIIGEKEKSSPEYISFFSDERDLLINFFRWFNQADPDIMIGWHVIGFDLLFLENKCRELNIQFDIYRGKGRATIRQRKPGSYFASVSGRVIIDGPTSLRASFFSFEDFKLETVAQELLGTGKTITPDDNKVEEIDRMFNEDKAGLAEYNLLDAVLVTDIFKKTGLIALSVRRSQISGLLMDQLGMMTAAFDHFYLPKLHKAGFVAPNVKDIPITEHASGGYVIEPDPGIYDNIVVLDFKSLYPSIIQTFKIDPFSLIMKKKDTIKTLNGYEFSSTEHILPDFIDELMKLRETAKKKKDKQLSQAIKILMNSFYGVMGSYGCRFYHPDLPRAITGTGHKLLLGSKDYLESKELKVVYGDTDSLFIQLPPSLIVDGEKEGMKIAEDLNSYWDQKINNENKADSYLELEFEKYYKKFIITPARGAEVGAKKRYAGLLEKDGKESIEFVGMEFVRSDWTRLAKEFQVELYEKIFKGEDVEDWVRSIINDLKNGMYDEKLVYRKRLRKDVEEYVKNIPPHARAAKLLQDPGDTIYYVITLRGPIPVELKHTDLDYEHYIEKQLKPIADSVLGLLGKNFDFIANNNQLSFFS